MPSLSPSSFRVYDKQEKRYLEDDSSKISYELDRYGNLTKWVEASPDGGYQPHSLDPNRFVVERFTGCYDLDKRPIYDGDLVTVLGFANRAGKCAIRSVSGNWMVEGFSMPTLSGFTVTIVGTIHVRGNG